MLTVLMATHNGAHTLPRVLDAYRKLDSPRGGWKLVIVNNGSTDDTKDIIASFEGRLPLTCIWEPTPGKNTALNTGLSNIAGDLAVMTDDDAVPDRDWLVQMRRAADSQPAFAMFGGSIVPQWEVTPESWILPFCQALSITDPTWKEGPIAPSLIFGPNLAVRSEVIEAGYRFDVNLGPMGSLYQMGDETDFLTRISNGGFKAWHCKGAVVAHIIRKDQMNKRWMLRRARANGRAMYRWEYTQETEPLKPVLLFGFPRYLLREIFEQGVRVAKSKLSKDSVTSFREEWKLHDLIGRAQGGRSLHRTAPGSGEVPTSTAIPNKAG